MLTERPLPLANLEITPTPGRRRTGGLYLWVRLNSSAQQANIARSEPLWQVFRIWMIQCLAVVELCQFVTISHEVTAGGGWSTGDWLNAIAAPAGSGAQAQAASPGTEVRTRRARISVVSPPALTLTYISAFLARVAGAGCDTHLMD